MSTTTIRPTESVSPSNVTEGPLDIDLGSPVRKETLRRGLRAPIYSALFAAAAGVYATVTVAHSYDHTLEGTQDAANGVHVSEATIQQEIAEAEALKTLQALEEAGVDIQGLLPAGPVGMD